MIAPQSRIWPVILSGGAGTRLWPLSRTLSPKQLLAMAGAETMIATTAARVADRARFHPPIVVTGTDHAPITRELLGLDVCLVVEPAPRNTAAAIALALLAIAGDDPAGLILVMPSDHRLAAPAVLLDAVATASETARAGWLVTFGIRAATPETGYGYIAAGPALGGGLREAAAFIEKPDCVRAQGFVAGGNHSWNSGIFLFSADAMRSALAAHAPAVLAAAEAAMAGARREAGTITPDAGAFASSPAISIDHAVFEQAARVAVLPIDPGWSDIGSWDALHALGVADAEGNVTTGASVAIDTRGCLLRAEGVILATIGIANLNIVATPDAVLVMARGRGEEVRGVATRLAGDRVLARPVIEHHNWGTLHIVHDGAGTGVRKACIDSGATLALYRPGTRVMLVSGRATADGSSLVCGAPAVAAARITAEASAPNAVLLLLD